MCSIAYIIYECHTIICQLTKSWINESKSDGQPEQKLYELIASSELDQQFKS